MSENIKGFKLNYSGHLEQFSEEDFVKYFNPFDILTFYDGKHRKLYIWIGKKAPPSLKSHIPSIREIFLRDYPNLKIFRNITVEFGSEPQDFFQTIEVSEQKYREYLNKLETKMLPVVSEINRLKTEADKYFISENFEKAIEIATKIIDLAKDIEDKALEANQLNFIEEAKAREKAKKIVAEIEEECKHKTVIFDNLNKAKNYKEAHKIVDEFRSKYKNDVNLMSIPIAQELILKDENMIYSLRNEQQSLKHKFETLEQDFNNKLKANKINQAELILEESKQLLDSIIDKEVTTQWELLENALYIKKNKNVRQIEELSKEAIDFLDKHQIIEVNKVYEKIINLLGQIVG